MLRGPLSVGVSLLIAITLLYLPNNNYVSASWVTLTVAVVMDMGAPERIILRSIQRCFGSIIGASLGLLVVFIIEHSDSPMEIKIIQCIAMISVTAASAFLINSVREWSYVFLVVIFSLAISIYKASLQAALMWICSVLTGTVIVFLVLGIFHYPSASNIVQTHFTNLFVKCLDGFVIERLKSIIGISHHHSNSTVNLHELTHQLVAAYEALNFYSKVHKFIKKDRAKIENFQIQYETLRNFYHTSHAFSRNFYRNVTDSDHFDLKILQIKEALEEIRSAVMLPAPPGSQQEHVETVNALMQEIREDPLSAHSLLCPMLTTVIDSMNKYLIPSA
jgi:Fusaric acid resistance protein-like